MKWEWGGIGREEARGTLPTKRVGARMTGRVWREASELRESKGSA